MTKASIYARVSTQRQEKEKTIESQIAEMEEVCKFKFINVPLYYRRVHEGGISQGINEFKARIYLPYEQKALAKNGEVFHFATTALKRS